VESIWPISSHRGTPHRPKRFSESDFDSGGPSILAYSQRIRGYGNDKNRVREGGGLGRTVFDAPTARLGRRCPGRSRAPGSVANAALSHDPLSRLPAMGTPPPGKSGPTPANRSSGRRAGGRRGALAYKHAANMRARALSAVIRDIRAAGFISYNAVARELNRRQVPTLRHGKQWYPTTVSRLLVRLAKMRS
jgi:hypothetical protein